MDLHTKTTTYALISKKYLTRYVLIYDVLPLELCYMVDGKPFFGSETLYNLLVRTKLSDKDVVLEFKAECSTPYVSMSELIGIGFTTQNSLDLFKERTYSNFDVEQLNCRVIETPEITSKSDSEIEVLPPAQIDKFDFTKKMALGDAVTVLAHNQLLDNGWPDYTAEKHFMNKEETIDFLLGTAETSSAKRELAASFFRLCTVYNVDRGWPTSEIIDSLDSTSSTAIKQMPNFDLLLSTSRMLLNNEGRHIKFSDEGDVVLRAIMLVLLNPELRNLEAMKDSAGEDVYKLAEKFSLARVGYSFLSAKEREEVGAARTFLQKFNADFHNPAQALKADFLELREELTTADMQYAEEKVADSVMDLHHHKWLSFSKESEQGKIISINGIKPYAGYSLDLVLQEKKSFSLCIIDAGESKGMERYKGKLIQEIVEVQKHLPEASRFEKHDHGLYLTLPVSWAEAEDLKDKLKDIFTILEPLGFEQKRSAIS